MLSGRVLSESLTVEDDDVEVLDNFEMMVEDSVESESVISVEVENLSVNPDDSTLSIRSGSVVNHLSVEVNSNDDEIVTIDNTEVVEASDNETLDQVRDFSRPSTSRPRPELRRMRSVINRANDRRQPKHRNDASDDSNSDAEMPAEELIRKKLSLVKASKRSLNVFCNSSAAKKSRLSGGSQGLAAAASQPVGEASPNTVQDLLGENARLRQELASTSSKCNKYDNLIAVLQARVECPVCYEVPKQAPVSVCSNGHVVCQACKRNFCPTCRVRMGVGTSVLAVTVIENIPHHCQFQLNGCQETCSLATLPSHQAVCKYRTVKCPKLSCDQRVPLNELINHTTINRCVRFGTFINNITYNYNVTANIVESNSGGNFSRKPDGIVFNGEYFFFKLTRKSSVSMWYLYVQMAGGEEESKVYKATIHVFKASAGVDGKNSHRFIGEVCPIDMDNLEPAAEAGYCCVLTDAQMKKLLTEGLEGGERMYSFSVKIKIEVEDSTPREATPLTENSSGIIQTEGSDGGGEGPSDQTDREGLRNLRRRELNLAQSSSQSLPSPPSPIHVRRTVAGSSRPHLIQPTLSLDTSSDTTSDEELVLLLAVGEDSSGTRVTRARARPRRHC